MTALYENRLESCLEETANNTLADTAAKLALESVLRIMRDIIETEDERNAPITLPAIILYYVVAKAVIAIPSLHPGHMDMIPDIKKFLTAWSQKNKLAGMHRHTIYKIFRSVCVYFCLTSFIDVYVKLLQVMTE